jgi:hypothetical protein
VVRRAGVEWRIRVRFMPRDLWVGLYVGPFELGLGPRGQFRERTAYLCLVPTLPIVITRCEWR